MVLRSGGFEGFDGGFVVVLKVLEGFRVPLCSVL